MSSYPRRRVEASVHAPIDGTVHAVIPVVAGHGSMAWAPVVSRYGEKSPESINLAKLNMGKLDVRPQRGELQPLRNNSASGNFVARNRLLLPATTEGSIRLDTATMVTGGPSD